VTQQALVIVGAGPAGMAAAVAAAQAGLRPLIIDENPQAGGQIYRQPPPALSDGLPQVAHISETRGATLLNRFYRQKRIELLAGASVWGLFPPRQLAITQGNSSRLIEAQHLVLATGVYEYLPPFPGWTLLGVMTPGAAQSLVKAMHVLPGRRALVAGTGPFLLVVAGMLYRAGMEVAGVVEMAPLWDAVHCLPGLLVEPGLLREGLGYHYRLRRAGIPVHRGHVLIEARGEREVCEAVFAPCDSEGHPDRTRSRMVQVDTVCAGYGFVPRIQLAQLAGCALRFDEARGGWVPRVDEDFQTSVPGVWVAGDSAGVAGAVVAELEGTLVGLAVARQLGALDSRRWQRLRKPVTSRLARLGRFRAALDRVYRLRPGLVHLVAPDTLVCRCEELTRAEVEAGIAAGGVDLRTLKVLTRLGMGPCQGRMCWPAAARLLAAHTGQPMQEVGPLSIRPPIRPVRLESLCELIPPANGGGPDATGCGEEDSR
jgi:NADPH-dependent 2,4-dienoyl-CoA reductase/sulfur reductase-like enzyme